MKVLIVGCFDLIMHPYVQKYIDVFDTLKIDYSFIYWNRDGKISKSTNGHFIPFDCKMDTYSKRMNKIKSYISYRRFVSKHVKENQYDKCIFLATQTMTFLFDIALSRFKNNYIFDYRDETYERNFFYKKIVEICLKNSYVNIISSPGFKKLFPYIEDSRFIICHNDKDNFIDYKIVHDENKKIRIVFWGQIRLPEYFKKLILIFGNDERFEVYFHGEGVDNQLIEYVKHNRFNNIFFTGKFVQDDIPIFAEHTDYIINCYSNNSYQRYALTVKMYEAIYFRLPMIVQKNSFMEEYLEQYNYPFISIDLDGEDDYELFKNKLLEVNIINGDFDIKKQIDEDKQLFKSNILRWINDGEKNDK